MTLGAAVETALVECLGLSAGERALVVTDPPTAPIARALAERARELGAETVLSEMSERPSNGSEPPEQVAAAMLACDVCIAPTAKSLSHTQARHAATQSGVRCATMPGITADILSRTLSADYAGIRKRSRALAAALTDASEVHVTSAAGTDVTFFVDDRKGFPDDGDLRAPGAFGNLPAGEGFIAPVEGRTTGRVVFDGSIWPIGLLEEPLVAAVEGGFATFSGPSAARLISVLEPHGKDAFAVAELGIGTNEAARLSGNILEDEKILGSIHVAFGDNHSFGGTIRVASHQDGVVLSPTVEFDSALVMDAGRLVI